MSERHITLISDFMRTLSARTEGGLEGNDEIARDAQHFLSTLLLARENASRNEETYEKRDVTGIDVDVTGVAVVEAESKFDD